MKGLIRNIALSSKNYISNRNLRHSVTFSSISEEVSYIKNRQNNIGYFFPYHSLRSTDRRQLSNLRKGFHEHLFKKYCEGNIQILKSDIVVDCGAFVGGFSVAAVLAGARKVISIEPSRKNFTCLRLNLALYGIESALPLNIGLGSAPGTAKLNLSASGCDDSILEPDEGDLHTSEDIEIDTVERLIARHGIESEDLYLKVEAEGFEPEIIDGLGTVRPRVIVVDVTPERGGESPRESIHEKLRALGYNSFKNTERCLFCFQ